ncbi:MAG: PorT family protein [Candidatus Symbiothrix sp.]|jgi:hypothetical protein|nr:PorT family protein [Candidatus Symbiothrix sp.]
MKIKLVSILFFIGFSIPAFAQWGIKGGLNYSDIAKHPNVSYRLGGYIGVTYDKPLSSKWYFQPGLLFTSYGTNIEGIPGFFKPGSHVAIYGVEAPFNFSFRPKIGENMKLVTDAGLYARYGLFGEKKYVYTDGETIQGSPFDAYNRFDLGINFGLGIQKGIYSVSASYLAGIANAEKGISTSHQMFRLSIGYQF